MNVHNDKKPSWPKTPPLSYKGPDDIPDDYPTKSPEPRKKPVLVKTESEEQIQFVSKFGKTRPRRNSQIKNKGRRFDSADYFQSMEKLKHSSSSESITKTNTEDNDN